MGGNIVNVDKDLELGTNTMKLLSCRNSSSSINDLTVGNATILIYTRVIGQQAMSYEKGINTLANEFASVTTSIFADTCTCDI